MINRFTEMSSHDNMFVTAGLVSDDILIQFTSFFFPYFKTNKDLQAKIEELFPFGFDLYDELTSRIVHPKGFVLLIHF